MDNNSKIGGEWAVLCYNQKPPRKYQYWIHKGKHFESKAQAKYSYTMPFAQDGTHYYLLVRQETIWERDNSARVKYEIQNYAGKPIGVAEVTWTRGRERLPEGTRWLLDPTKALLDFNGYGAGIGFEGSDFDSDIKTSFSVPEPQRL